MRRASVLWGTVLVLAGVLLLLGNLGLLPVGFWQVLWPLLLILLGVWALGGSLGRRPPTPMSLAVPLGTAARGRVRVHHGAGRLDITGGAAPAALVAGTFGGGVDSRTTTSGDELTSDLRVAMDTPQMWGPWAWQRGSLDWSLRLSDAVPLALELDTGASSSRVDLTSVTVTELKLSTGASSTEVVLPATAGHTSASVRSGVASVKLTVPPGVAAKIRGQAGLATIEVDQARFPRTDTGWASPDYDTAANRVEMTIETGVGSVTVR